MRGKTLLGFITLAFLSIPITGCGVSKQSQVNNSMVQAQSQANNSMVQALSKVNKLTGFLHDHFQITRSPKQQFYGLTNGLQVNVEPTQTQSTGVKYVQSMTNLGFFQIPTITYVRSMGFKEVSPSQDYTLTIKQNRIDVNTLNGEINIMLGVQLKDPNGSIVYNQDAYSTNKNTSGVDVALNDAYTSALEQINWNQIASFLKAAQFARNEPTKAVDGLGSTALEQTIIRWDVQSRPQGADIFWRVVSKTPNVKSTNNKYLTTTPYEATKALDIRGLTYQNSGNVRIILRCEKDGYMPQEKEYDVRMVLDQEEISSFFRLVEEQ